MRPNHQSERIAALQTLVRDQSAQIRALNRKGAAAMVSESGSQSSFESDVREAERLELLTGSPMRSDEVCAQLGRLYGQMGGPLALAKAGPQGAQGAAQGSACGGQGANHDLQERCAEAGRQLGVQGARYGYMGGRPRNSQESLMSASPKKDPMRCKRLELLRKELMHQKDEPKAFIVKRTYI